MKIFIKILLPSILISSFLFSEEYVCSSSLEGFSDPENKKVVLSSYDRNGNIFIRTNQYGKSEFNILKETESFIILTKTYIYPDIFITIINKNTKTYSETYLVGETGLEKVTNPTIGRCIVK